MTGEPGLNREAFEGLEAALRSAGIIARSPVHNPPGTIAEHLLSNMQAIADSDCVFALPGYEGSPGCSVEMAFAWRLGVPVYEARSFMESGALVKVCPGLVRVPAGHGPGDIPDTRAARAEVHAMPGPGMAFMDRVREMVRLHDAKRADYTGQTGDILYNYRTSARLAGLSTSRGIYARLCEKLVRLSVLIGGDRPRTGESLHDTCMDLAVMALLLDIALAEEAGQ